MGAVECCSVPNGVPCCGGKSETGGSGYVAAAVPGAAAPLELGEVVGFDPRLIGMPGMLLTKAEMPIEETRDGFESAGDAAARDPMAKRSSGFSSPRSSHSGPPLPPPPPPLPPLEEPLAMAHSASASSGGGSPGRDDVPQGGDQTVTCEDGSTYRGQMLDGMRHGHGQLTCAEWSYDGEWQADQHHGEGTQRWQDGRVFRGHFCRGLFSGPGRMVWSNGSCYEGQYQDDLKHGRGKFTWSPNGCKALDCEWVEGKRHGRGVFTSSKGEVKCGIWEMDQWQRWELPPRPLEPEEARTAPSTVANASVLLGEPCVVTGSL